MTRRQIQKLIFHKDSIALIASLVFLWFTLGLIIDSNFDQKDLTKHSGKLVRIDSVITRIKDKPLFKEVTKELRLTIDTEQNYFTSVTTSHFGDITSKIAVGDTIAIFTTPKFWGIFGMKKPSDISQLTNGNLLVIDFEKYKMSISKIYILTLIASLGFFIFYYIRIRKRYIFDISKNP